MIEGI